MDPWSRSKLRGLAWLVGSVIVTILFAIGLDPLIRQIPWSAEQKIAERLQLFNTLEVCRSTTTAPPGDPLVRLVSRLHPILPSDFKIPLKVDLVRGDTVNAFASLGGRILIFEGLLNELHSPEELAAILAHEIEHLSNRDVLQGSVFRLITTLSMQLMLGGEQTIGAETTELLVHLRYGRRQESRADRGALARLERAEISPAGMATFFERLSQNRDSPMPEILSSHPESESRARIARSHAEKYKSTLLLDAKDWKQLQSGCS